VDTGILSLSAEVENEWNCTAIPCISLDGVEREEFIFKLSLDYYYYYYHYNYYSILKLICGV
jgi:hypothetical protein